MRGSRAGRADRRPARRRPRPPGSTSTSRAAPSAGGRRRLRRRSARAARSLRDAPPSRRATCGRGPRPRIEQEAAGRGRPPTASGAESSRVPVAVGTARRDRRRSRSSLGATALSGGWLSGPTVQGAGADDRRRAEPANGRRGRDADARRSRRRSAGSHTTGDGTLAYHVAASTRSARRATSPIARPWASNPAHVLDLAAAPKTMIGSPTDEQPRSSSARTRRAATERVRPDPARPSGADADPEADARPRRPSRPRPRPPTPTAPSASPTTTARLGRERDARRRPPASVRRADRPSRPRPPSRRRRPAPPVEPPEPATPSGRRSPPEPTVATALAIASGVTVVGEAAAFSADGDVVRVHARGPSDGSTARTSTSGASATTRPRPPHHDHRTRLRVLAGRPHHRQPPGRPATSATDGRMTSAVSVRLDPASGDRDRRLDGAVWRPALDPTGRFAVAWDGTVRTGRGRPRDGPRRRGGLRLVRWPADGRPPTTRRDVRSPASRAGRSATSTSAGTRPARGWRSGSADATDPTIGRLTPARPRSARPGRCRRPDGAPTDVPALPGFSIGDGRLAWVTPHGQDAEGSRVQIVAWSGDGVGSVESVPGEDVVVVR